MAVAAGTKLGPYVVADQLGVGGMGEVYRATDTRLERQVAIKVLPDRLAKEAGSLQRFEREAKAVSSLSHPHICTLHDVGQEGDLHYLVMELVTGETLAQRLSRGRVPLDEAVELAGQIADALATAHASGVVHRDLKPGNVMLTQSGVKVLDFGLAKLDSRGDLASSPDVRSTRAEGAGTPGGEEVPRVSSDGPITAEGMILGTLQYMSPEQLEGKSVDARTDIFALGVVVHEMITGERAFDGESEASLIAAILKDEPPSLLERQPTTSPGLDHVVRRCLAKDPDERWRSAADVGKELRWAARSGRLAEAVRTRQSRGLRAALGILALATIVVATALLTRRSTRPPPPVPFVVETPLTGAGRLHLYAGSAVALSRDGRQLAYVLWGAEKVLLLKPVRGLDVRQLASGLASYNPFFSPDGQWLGYVTPGGLWKVPTAGGAPIQLCRINRSRGASWHPDGTIVFSPDRGSGLMGISAEGGELTEITTLADGEASHRWPQFLPVGRRLLYTASSIVSGTDGDVHVVDLDSGITKLVHRGGMHARYAASGHLLFWREGTLHAAPFDPDTLQVTGTPVAVVEDVVGGPEGAAQFDVADDGTLVHVDSSWDALVRAPSRLVLVDRTGKREVLLEREARLKRPSLSPDGKRVAFLAGGAGVWDVWVLDRERDAVSRLTRGEDANEPNWSPDGRTLYFSLQRGPRVQPHEMPADGSREPRRLHASENDWYVRGVAPDGKSLLIDEIEPGSSSNIWLLPLDGGAPERILASPSTEVPGELSPDGRWLVYQSNQSGTPEVYVRGIADFGGLWQVSSGGGRAPRWSGDGRRLLFAGTGQQVMEASVAPEGEGLKIGRPAAAFGKVKDWAASRDFEYLVSAEMGDWTGDCPDLERRMVRFTFHWFEELERLVPTE